MENRRNSTISPLIYIIANLTGHARITLLKRRKNTIMSIVIFIFSRYGQLSNIVADIKYSQDIESGHCGINLVNSWIGSIERN